MDFKLSEEQQMLQDTAARLVRDAYPFDKREGFGASELERAKKWTLAGYDRAYSERDKTESGSYVQEYINNFLEGEPSPGIAYEHQLANEAIPAVTLSDVNAAARHYAAR